jgi:septum formation inhibitor MinC
VIFKGTGRTLKVVLSAGADLAEARISIEEKLAANPSFYLGQRITVESKEGPMPDAFSKDIRDVFGKYGLSCSVSDRKSAAEKASALITQTVLMDEVSYMRKRDITVNTSGIEASSVAEVFSGDIVPGKSLVSDGSVLILGDVLSGGKVQAAGDIMIMGIAGGNLQAGWPEDRSSRIIAGGFAAGWALTTMYAIEQGADGLTVKAGDAGYLARKEEGN